MDFTQPDVQPVRVLDTVPLHWQRFAMLHANTQCRYSEFENAEIFSQLIPGNGYTIRLHQFYCTTPVTLLATPVKAELTLNYLLKGNIIMDTPVTERSCWRCPTEPFHMNMEPGRSSIFQVNYFEQLKIEDDEEHIPLIISIETKEIIESVLTKELYQGMRELFLDARVRDLLRLYLEQKQANDDILQMPDMHGKVMLQIEQYISSHLDQRLSVPGVARKFNMSRSWLQRLCRRNLNKGFHAWVKEKRMIEAARLLLTTNESVSGIVLKVTDMSFASFSAAFHIYFGMTPTEYRKAGGQFMK